MLPEATQHHLPLTIKEQECIALCHTLGRTILQEVLEVSEDHPDFHTPVTVSIKRHYGDNTYVDGAIIDTISQRLSERHPELAWYAPNAAYNAVLDHIPQELMETMQSELKSGQLTPITYGDNGKWVAKPQEDTYELWIPRHVSREYADTRHLAVMAIETTVNNPESMQALWSSKDGYWHGPQIAKWYLDITEKNPEMKVTILPAIFAHLNTIPRERLIPSPTTIPATSETISALAEIEPNPIFPIQAVTESPKPQPPRVKQTLEERRLEAAQRQKAHDLIMKFLDRRFHENDSIYLTYQRDTNAFGGQLFLETVDQLKDVDPTLMQYTQDCFFEAISMHEPARLISCFYEEVGSEDYRIPDDWHLNISTRSDGRIILTMTRDAVSEETVASSATIFNQMISSGCKDKLKIDLKTGRIMPNGNFYAHLESEIHRANPALPEVMVHRAITSIPLPTPVRNAIERKRHTTIRSDKKPERIRVGNDSWLIEPTEDASTVTVRLQFHAKEIFGGK